MSGTGTKKAPRKAGAGQRGAGGRSLFSHRGLIAIEAMLVLGVVKDVIFDRVRTSDLPNYGKVLVIMAATVGLFGGLFFVIERLTARGVANTHQVLKRMPVVLPTLVIHMVLLFLLVLLYARMLKIKVF